MALQIHRAERRKAKLRLALIGPTNSGKTYSALKMAFGIGGKIGLIDTEHGSGDLYADLGEYDVITLEPPFTVQRYREAIRLFEEAGYDVIIVDSLTHAWAGEGGLLDKQGQLEKDTTRFKNSFATWREITPEHNKLVEELLNSPSHIIATLRVKTEYVLEKNERGSLVPRKIGLAPVFRDGIEYEFTLVMDLSSDTHMARASKDRTTLFAGWSDIISEETGRTLKNWLESGSDAAPPVAGAILATPAPRKQSITEWLGDLERDLSMAGTEEDTDDILAREDVQKASSALKGDAKERFGIIIAMAQGRFLSAAVAPEDDGWPGPTPEDFQKEAEAAE